MKVGRFDTQHGIYKFQLDEFETQFHAHPAHEIILARGGSFSLSTLEKTWSNLKFAFIARNVMHMVEAVDCQSELMMTENTSEWAQLVFTEHGISLEGGVYVICVVLGEQL